MGIMQVKCPVILPDRIPFRVQVLLTRDWVLGIPRYRNWKDDPRTHFLWSTRQACIDGSLEWSRYRWAVEILYFRKWEKSNV